MSQRPPARAKRGQRADERFSGQRMGICLHSRVSVNSSDTEVSFWTLGFSDLQHRRDNLREGWKEPGRRVGAEKLEGRSFSRRAQGQRCGWKEGLGICFEVVFAQQVHGAIYG